MRNIMLIMFLLCTSTYTYAEKVTLTTSDGLVARADYRAGESNMPVVFLMHGFLQGDNSYQTIQILKNELHDAGYTVIAPTLTLGINDRKRSLECESIHLHSMTNDVVEIGMWMDWVTKNTPTKRLHLWDIVSVM